METSFGWALRGLLTCWMLGFAAGAAAQPADLSFLTTRPEATGFEETTRYEEVLAFLDVVAATSPRIHLTTFGYTTEGRALPLAVYGDVGSATPDAVRASGKTRVLVMGNIHGGEVCGKEAALILLRALAGGQHAAWADSLVLLVAPIYNADGNERIDLYNRPLQHGPVGGMGQRANAQGYDLNRDHMKLDAPETRSLVRLINRYDPHVVIDLHTTNGTRHAYHLTYAPPLHPNTSRPIIERLRGDWLPEVTRRIRDTYGWAYEYYGNVPREGRAAERGWYTFDHRPRFNTHYVGLRNRFGILSEAYSYATFEDRIHGTLYFVEELLDYAHTHAGPIRAACEAADRESVVGRSLALTARLGVTEPAYEILLGEVDEERNPFSGATMLRRRDVVRPERMPLFGHFEAAETAVAPPGYYIPAPPDVVLDRLTTHGISFDVLAAPRTVPVEQFRIDSVRVSERIYEGHHLQTLFGAFEAAEVELPAGTLVVDLDQPLARLAFTLLEPRSDDGLAAWGLLADALREAAYFPVLRARSGP